jgi:hypothetical protein
MVRGWELPKRRIWMVDGIFLAFALWREAGPLGLLSFFRVSSCLALSCWLLCCYTT